MIKLTVYLVSYDLVGPTRDYEPIIEKIKEYDNWVKILESVFVINSERTAVQIKNNLITTLDQNDKLFVAKLSGEYSTKELSTFANLWLLENLLNLKE